MLAGDLFLPVSAKAAVPESRARLFPDQCGLGFFFLLNRENLNPVFNKDYAHLLAWLQPEFLTDLPWDGDLETRQNCYLRHTLTSGNVLFDKYVNFIIKDKFSQ